MHTGLGQRAFGNARYVDDLVKQAKVNLGIRIMSKEVPQESSKRQLSLIQIEDIQKIKLSHRKGELEMPFGSSASHQGFE